MKLLCRYQRRCLPIIFIDESGFVTQSVRRYGYSRVGEKCYDAFNWQLKGRTNAIGAQLENKLLSVGLFEQSVNADTFHAWVEQTLLPQLEPTSVLVMDNAAFHKRQDIQALIKAAGHILLYLPAYSPDLNPIEKTWAKLKKLRSKLRCSVDQLFQQPIYA